MQFAEGGNDRLGAEPELCRAARVPRRTGIRNDLQVPDRSTGCVEQRQHLRFPIERIEILRLAALPRARLSLTRQENAERRMFRLSEIAASDFEEPHRHGAAIEVALRRGDQAWQHGRPHDLHVLADGVRKNPLAAAKGARLGFRDEGPCHRLVEAARGGSAP